MPSLTRPARSRFRAFAVSDAAYVLTTWHPMTRPDARDSQRERNSFDRKGRRWHGFAEACSRSTSVGRPLCSRKAPIGCNSPPVIARTGRITVAHSALSATAPPHRATIAAEVLRVAVQGEGGAMRERVLQHGRRESAVGLDGRAARPRNDRSDVNQLERGVARRLHDDEERVGPHRAAALVECALRRLGSEEPRGEQVP